MATETNRRNFLRARFGEAKTVRPYGAVAPDAFSRLCRDCDACVNACPEEIIELDEEGRARLSFSEAGCTFCGVCIEVCPTGALTDEAREEWSWIAAAETTCLSLNGISCRTCEDFCDNRAIRFKLQIGGKAQPLIDEENCIGCGNCVGACPAGAISLKRQTQSELETTV